MGEKQEKSDEKITSLIQAGNINLFEILVLRYEKKIMRYGRKFLSNYEDIEDTVQEIFLKTYKNIKSFDTKRKFSTWLYRIAHNEFVNVLKKRKKSPLSFFNFDTFLPQQAIVNDIHQDLFNKEIRQKLDSILNKLDPRYREPIILYYFEEMNYKEISEIMRMPISTVGVRIKRAKEKIKSIYQKLK
jgi:RNA polymerase sigma-70 factor (ECF subfamily)